jgi:vitamin B12 transporter
MIRSITAATFCLTVVTASIAGAQLTDTTTLNTVVVSATKTPASRVSLTQPVSVVTGEELRARGITRVVDALRAIPGATVAQNGSVGAVNTLFLRGGESRYTKVLVDGVAVNSSGGFFDFSHLTVDNIDRIEVVRGAGSVVHGSDAVSGTVQIFTRRGRGPLTMSAEGRAGNRGSREVTLDASGSARALRYSLGGGARRTDGIFSLNNNYYNGTLSGSAGIAPWDSTEVQVTGRYTNAEFHYPTDFTGAPVDSNAYRVQHRLTVGVDAKSRLTSAMNARILLGTNEVSDLTEDIVRPFAPGVGLPPEVNTSFLSRNKRRSAEGMLTMKLAALGMWNVGAEYLEETERSTNSQGPVGGPEMPTSTFAAKRDNKAVYSELIATSAAGSSWTLSARRDDNSDYEAFTSYRAGLSVPAGQMSRLRASISTSFSAPAFNQIHPTLYTAGSPGLKPERARAWEVGLEQTLAYGTIRISGSYFNQRFRDLIQYVDGGAPSFLGSYANLTEAESNGYEAELALMPTDELSASVSYTQVKPRVTEVSEEYTGELLPGDPLLRRPMHSGAATLTWSRRREGSLALLASYVGERPDLDFTEFPARRVTLPSYVKLDVAGSRALMRSASGRSAFSVTFRVDNVLDRKYEDVFRFSAPRRTYLVGARVEGAM